MTLLRLVARYGAPEVQTAILAALARGVPHPNAVRLALETQREARHAPPALAVQLSAAVRLRDAVIQSHRLDSYDQLAQFTQITQTTDPSGEDDEPEPQ